jgi:hypothetical protein
VEEFDALDQGHNGRIGWVRLDVCIDGVQESFYLNIPITTE